MLIFSTDRSEAVFLMLIVLCKLEELHTDRRNIYDFTTMEAEGEG